MKPIFLALTTAIVTHFLLKTYNKIAKPQDLSTLKQEAAREAEREAARVHVQYASTPRSSDAWLSSIGTVGELAAMYKKNIPAPKEPCDHAALRPVMGR